MIDGSEKRNRQLASELQNSHICEKRSKRSQLERREKSIFRTFLEVNKPFATDLFAFGNYLF